MAELLEAEPDKAAADAAPQTQPPFQFEVRKLSLAGYRIQFSDAATDEPVKLDAQNISIDAENFSSQKDRRGKFMLALNLNKSGALSATGELGINPLATRLAVDIKGIKLKPFQPYFTDQLNIIVTNGAASAKGELKVADEGRAAPKVSFAGDASLDRLATIDKLNEEDFLKWNRLHFKRINVATQPLRVDIAEVALADFYSLLIIHPDGRLNLQQIVKEKNVAMAEKAKVTGTTATQPKPAIAAEDKPIVTISKLSLSGGQVDFSDHFIKPNYSAHLTGLGGDVKGLSSDASTLAEVALKGRVDNQGRLDINIAGQADAELDRQGLKQVMLERKVKTQKFNELQIKGNDVAAIDFVGLAKDLPIAEMEKLMLAHFQASEDDLRDLINHRAMEAKEYLINEGKVEPERVFIVTTQATKPGQEEKEADKGKRSRVNFTLGVR